MVGSGTGFTHEVLTYRSADELTHGALAFVTEGLQQNERVVIAVAPGTSEVLRSALGSDRDDVVFVDDIGNNPGRRMSMWQGWLDTGTDAEADRTPGVRGVGEPIWAGRRADDIVESRHHESLLNLAFSDTRPWQLMCVYDGVGLPADVVEQARRWHPFVIDRGSRVTNAGYTPDFDWTLRDPLPSAPGQVVDRTEFDLGDLARLRALVATAAAQTGVSRRRVLEFVTAVNEITTNSVMHGGGHGVLCLWWDDRGLVVEISDRGQVGSPLVGRLRFSNEDRQPGGLWFANQVCDLVQLRSTPDSGTIVRLHLRPG